MITARHIFKQHTRIARVSESVTALEETVADHEERIGLLEGPTLFAPDTGSLVLTGLVPTAIADVDVSPAAGSIALTGLVPEASSSPVLEPDSGALTITGFAPTWSTV